MGLRKFPSKEEIEAISKGEYQIEKLTSINKDIK